MYTFKYIFLKGTCQTFMFKFEIIICLLCFQVCKKFETTLLFNQMHVRNFKSCCVIIFFINVKYMYVFSIKNIFVVFISKYKDLYTCIFSLARL